MKRILKNKFFAFAVLAGLIITLIMSFAQIPSAKSTMKNIPIGIVNEDGGQVGNQLTKKVLDNKTKAAHSDQPMFKWHEYQNASDAKKTLNFNGDYATVIIPKNLSTDMAKLPQTGQPIKVKLIINQGRNNTLSTSITQILSGMFTKIGSGIGANMLSKMDSMHVNIPAGKATVLANPFEINTETVHKTTNLENATSVFFQPIWIASLVVTLLFYFASKSFKPRHKKDVLNFKLTVIGLVAVISAMIGFTATFYANTILGYDFSNPTNLSIFLSIASFSFIMLFSGFISWLGIPGLAIFGILLFFGLPLLIVAPEMLPTFYQDWVLPWLPMRFLYEGVREMLYYNDQIFNQNTISLLVTALIGTVLFFFETFNKRHKNTFIK